MARRNRYFLRNLKIFQWTVFLVWLVYELQNSDEISKSFVLLSKRQINREISSYFCGLLKMYEIYKQVLDQFDQSNSDVTLTPHDGRWHWILNQLSVTKNPENGWSLVTNSKFSAIFHRVVSMWHPNYHEQKS